MTLTAGTKLGPYEILAPIGAGGMGEVYRARDERLKRDIAIKVLPPELAEDSERRGRFEREARTRPRGYRIRTSSRSTTSARMIRPCTSRWSSSRAGR